MKKVLKYLLLVLSILIIGAGIYGSYYFYNKTGDYNFEKDKYNADKEAYDRQASDLEKGIADAKSAAEAKKSTKTTTTAPAETSSEISTSTWKTFTNSKYGYSFKYPGSFTLGPCTTNPCQNFVDEQQGGDIVLLQGDIATDGWPNIQVLHYDTATYNPPAGSNLNEVVLGAFDWLTEYFPASPNIVIPKTSGDDIVGADLTMPASPQSYGTRYIFYIVDDMLFQITMNDPETAEAQAFYNAWMGTYTED